MPTYERQELLCRECGKPITKRAKCGALFCGDCCRDCKTEDGGICPSDDFARANRENQPTDRATTYIR